MPGLSWQGGSIDNCYLESLTAFFAGKKTVTASEVQSALAM
jgi:hypothetical protein